MNAEDGAEILFGVARLMDQQQETDSSYAQQIRDTANAVYDITDELREWTALNESNPVDRQHVEEKAERDSVFGANEHRSELAHQLRLN